LNVWLNDKIGFGKIITLGALCQLVAYLMIIPAPPFPVIICAYVIVGFGLSLQASDSLSYIQGLIPASRRQPKQTDSLPAYRQICPQKWV